MVWNPLQSTKASAVSEGLQKKETSVVHACFCKVLRLQEAERWICMCRRAPWGK